MRQPALLAFFGIAFLFAALYLKATKDAPIEAGSSVKAWTLEALKSNFASTPADSRSGLKQSPPLASQKDEESLRLAVQTLVKYSHGPQQLEDLLEELKTSGQRPLVARDKNPYTGEMAIVRTSRPLPGTRYFHAQYFADEKGRRFLQHLSFEFRPGKDAFRKALDAIHLSLPGLGRPDIETETYKEWKLHNGYAVWVKKLEAQDLDPNDPYNSYGPEDIGTIRIAIEEDPHALDEHDHKHASN